MRRLERRKQVKLMKLSTHPELNRIALKRSLDLPYVVWLILRHEIRINNHSSHFNTHSARKVCMNFGLNFSLRHWRRIWKSGERIFWGQGYGKIHLRSFKRVYNLLADDTAKNVPSPLFIEIEIYKTSIERRAELYMSWFASRGEITIARATITELFNLSADQQREYETILDGRLLVKSNYCHIDAKKYRNNPIELPPYYNTFVHEKFENDRVSDETTIFYQMPNTYIPSKAHNANAATFAPRRCIGVSRTLYRHTNSLYQPKRYHLYLSDLSQIDGKPEYVRTYFQGKKRINRIGHYL